MTSSNRWQRVIRLFRNPGFRVVSALRGMALGALPPMEGYGDQLPHGFIGAPKPPNFRAKSVMLRPETVLFLAIDVHCNNATV